MARHSSFVLALLIASLHAGVPHAASAGEAVTVAALVEDDTCLSTQCGLGLLQTGLEKQTDISLDHGVALETKRNGAFEVFNATTSGQLLLQLEYELEVNEGHGTKNPVILVLLELFGLGLCGCDRCYMGQTCLGTLKAATIGGVLVWAIVDYIAVVITCLSLSPGINALGYRAAFPQHAVPAAFIVTVTFLTAKFFYGVLQAKTYAVGDRKHAEQQLVLMFAGWDKNCDGFLTVEELNKALHYSAIFIEEKRFSELVRETGTAADGKVDYKAFARVLASK